MLLSTASSAWAVFQTEEDETESNGETNVQVRGPPVEYGREEKASAQRLRGWWDDLSEEIRGNIVAAVPSEKKKGHGKGAGKDRENRRKSWVDGKHELRDGTTYTDETVEERSGVHELRDGKAWRDEIP